MGYKHKVHRSEGDQDVAASPVVEQEVVTEVIVADETPSGYESGAAVESGDGKDGTED